jgi:hypothetical protein
MTLLPDRFGAKWDVCRLQASSGFVRKGRTAYRPLGPKKTSRVVAMPRAPSSGPRSGRPRGRPVAGRMVPKGPRLVTIAPVMKIELERVEALELLGMMLAHLNDAEARAEVSPRAPLLMAIRDKLARGLREES